MSTRSSTTTSSLLLEMDASKRESPLNPLASLPTRSLTTLLSFTTPTKSPSTRWPNTPNLRTSLSVMRRTDGRLTKLMDMTLQLLRRPSPLPRPPTTESPSSLSATPSSEREWKRLREPTLPTERPVFLTSTRLVPPSAFPRKSGLFLRELATSSRVSKRRTPRSTLIGKPPTPHGRRPTPKRLLSLRPPSTTTLCLLRR
mmetsp:Transcript_4707/g.9942  ORF Transcript_4707/g.9942 Transcript_4707/m.9942 type:complete len:200 (+) Transcript_4707:714-1313(+)